MTTTGPSKPELEQRLGVIEDNQRPSAFRERLEAAVSGSPFFRLAKWGALVVLAVVFGGTIWSGYQVSSLADKSREAEKSINDIQGKASEQIDQKRREVSADSKDIEEKMAGIRSFLNTTQAKIFAEAEERANKAAADVETTAVRSKESIEAARVSALKEIADQSAGVKTTVDAAQSQVAAARDTAAKEIQDQVGAVKKFNISSQDQVMKDARDRITTASADAERDSEKAIKAVEETRDVTQKKISAIDLPSLPTIRNTLNQLKTEVDALGAKEKIIRFQYLKAALGPLYIPFIISLATVPLLALYALFRITAGVIRFARSRKGSKPVGA